MATNYDKPHISRIESFSSPRTYQYPPRPIPFPVAKRDRTKHGSVLLEKLESIKKKFDLDQETEPDEGILKDEVVYVKFISEWNFKLKFDQLDSSAKKFKYQILSIKEVSNPENKDSKRYEVLVVLSQGGISHFIKKVRQYLEQNQTYKGKLTDKPIANELVSNIADIQLATLSSFWMDYPEIPFPKEDEVVWWEAWFRKTPDYAIKANEIESNLKLSKCDLGISQLEFPEHFVRLVKGSARQLSESLLLLDSLSELRKPQELSEFLLHDDVSSKDRRAWLQDLLIRTSVPEGDKVVVCLLDSGVNNRHPLISNFLPDQKLYAWKEDWGTNDNVMGGGHGTGMAGLVLYGDMTDAISTPIQIQIGHELESFKIYNPNSPNIPELYGAIIEYACSTPVVDDPKKSRVFCLSVTNTDYTFFGRPSSSSSSLDKITFGSSFEEQFPQLVLVSGGNVYIELAEEYPHKNLTESVQDPGQAYNAITVGSYTRKDRIDQDSFPGWEPLATNGAMAPSNSTGLLWESNWPNKPDIVMEGGNLAKRGSDVDMKDSLQLITAHNNHDIKPFQTFGDTSAAVALASKMAAELRSSYPNFWPETIRGLMIHSAQWTPEMLKNLSLSTQEERKTLIRTVGYGTPILEKAMYSANNCLTLISQTQIQPYRKEGPTVKYNEYHLYDIPWPTHVLEEEVGSIDATLTVTLSYFIEPNPGNKQYATSFRYHSHELDFKIIKRSESLSEFMARISADSRISDSEENISTDNSSEGWSLKERVRSKGSIKKDFITSSGVELASRNKIAIYPKNGWYKLRKKLEKYNSKVRYSLIVSIETESTEIDLYTPVNVTVPLQISH